MDPEEVFSLTDCETERTPAELLEWVEEKTRLLRSISGGDSQLLPRTGLARKFLDEMYPLSLLAKHLFGERLDVVCKPNLEDDEFDAIVIDYRDPPLRVQKIEFVHAILCYEEFLHRLYLQQKAPVFTFGKLGGKEKKSAHASDEAVPHVVLLNKGLELLVEAARTKSGKAYGRDTSLVIVFDDYATFRTRDDVAKLEEFINAEILPIDLDFERLFLLGWSGETILGYLLSGPDMRKARSS
jgi:hypothetical protein